MACKNCTTAGCQCVVIGDGTIIDVTGAGDALSPYEIAFDGCAWLQTVGSGTFVSGSTPVLIKTGGTCAVATITIPAALDLCTEIQDLASGTFVNATTQLVGVNAGVCELVTIDIGGNWTNYSPTFTGVTVGSGVVAGRWAQIGDVVHFTASFVLAADSAVAGPITVSLPAAMAAGAQNNHSSIHATFFDTSATAFSVATCSYTTSSTYTLRATNAAGTYLTTTTVSSTIPFTWATGDSITVSGTYEV